MIYAPQSQKEAHKGFVIKKTQILYRKIRDMNIPSHTTEQPARTHTRERERENVSRHLHTRTHKDNSQQNNKDR